MAREDKQVNVRLPEELLEKLRASADQAGRSVTSEIVKRLRETFPNPSAEMLANRQKELFAIRDKMGALWGYVQGSQTEDPNDHGGHTARYMELIRNLGEVEKRILADIEYLKQLDAN